MSIEDVDKKIRENAEKIRALMDEGNKLKSERVKILYKNKMSAFEPGKYVLVDAHGEKRIGKITKIEDFINTPYIEFEGFSDYINDSTWTHTHTYSTVSDDATFINITDKEFEAFKQSVINRQQNYRKTIEHADRIKSSFQSFFLSTINMYCSKTPGDKKNE